MHTKNNNLIFYLELFFLGLNILILPCSIVFIWDLSFHTPAWQKIYNPKLVDIRSSTFVLSSEMVAHSARP